MIVITGSVDASEATLDELLRRSIEHVVRSRQEPGCLSHAVHRDVEHPLRLVFLEQWTDMDAVREHFAVPATQEFAAAMNELSTERPTITIYEASKLS